MTSEYKTPFTLIVEREGGDARKKHGTSTNDWRGPIFHIWPINTPAGFSGVSCLMPSDFEDLRNDLIKHKIVSRETVERDLSFAYLEQCGKLAETIWARGQFNLFVKMTKWMEEDPWQEFKLNSKELVIIIDNEAQGMTGYDVPAATRRPCGPTDDGTISFIFIYAPPVIRVRFTPSANDRFNLMDFLNFEMVLPYGRHHPLKGPNRYVLAMAVRSYHETGSDNFPSDEEAYSESDWEIGEPGYTYALYYHETKAIWFPVSLEERESLRKLREDRKTTRPAYERGLVAAQACLDGCLGDDTKRDRSPSVQESECPAKSSCTSVEQLSQTLGMDMNAVSHNSWAVENEPGIKDEPCIKGEPSSSDTD
ncbi:hypothetical protein CGLO_09304 [Colletotrichum gloeosporioides Cg-14]|uniref:Uncharacterized protein n=1 Tax=Colletotrichum gloeosporioides (strain Cg-14) TaxID=1237896 RepID=T0LI05_COLGC|nr:hypothetical protein CGLO_09304 [Colletotrichum gloeosporioides Cg-14]